VLGSPGEILTHYGILEHIITISLPEAQRSLQPAGPLTSIFAFIFKHILKEDDPQLAGLDIHFLSRTKQTLEVIDITDRKSVV